MAKIDLNKIVTSVQKTYAKDKKAASIITTGDQVRMEYTDKDVVKLPMGHPLQVLLGLPGIPFNKIIQVAGKPDCGKSTWASEVAVSAQKQGVQVVYWDAEEKFDAKRFKAMGGNPSDLLMAKTNEILKGAELMRKYVIAIKEQQEDAKILLIWDSVGASQSRSEAERELDSEKHANPGANAKDNAAVMRMVTALQMKYPDSLATYLINQVYPKIGFMQKGDAMSGGSKIEYASSAIITLKRIKVLTKTVKGVEVKYGIVTRAVNAKPHLAQSDTTVHRLDFQITAKGSEVTETSEGENEDD